MVFPLVTGALGKRNTMIINPMKANATIATGAPYRP